MGLYQRIYGVDPATGEVTDRAVEAEAAASFSPPSVLVVGEGAPVGRTVSREVVYYHDAVGRTQATVVVTMSPFERRRLAGTVPTGGTAPIIEGR